MLFVSALIILAVVTAAWLRQAATKNANAIDAIWAAGVGAHTMLLALLERGNPSRRAVIAVLVGAWALRLAGHLFFDRVLGGKPEDGRYARFRQRWSQGVFYAFYLAQGALIFLLPLTFLAAFRSARPFPSALDLLGLAVWGVSIAGEWTADRQLARFRADPANRGKTCREGLWKYSRHPNYFFEWLLWCAYVPLSTGSPLFGLSLAGPALLLLLLLKVSGVPPTEEQALASRGEDYRRYQRTTSAFVPWFPKEGG